MIVSVQLTRFRLSGIQVATSSGSPRNESMSMIKEKKRLTSVLIFGQIVLGVAWVGRPTPAANVTDATITGVVSGLSRRAQRPSDAPPRVEVTIVDTPISAGLEPDGSFTLKGVPPSDVVKL